MTCHAYQFKPGHGGATMKRLREIVAAAFAAAKRLIGVLRREQILIRT